MQYPPLEILPLNEGWEKIYKMGVLPLQQSVEGQGTELWGANKFIMVYDLVFKLCIQRDPYNYSEQIYKNYCKVIGEYIHSGSEHLSRAQKDSDSKYLEEFYLRWTRFSIYINRMTKVFGYLDRFYTPNFRVRSTSEEGTFQFRKWVLSPSLGNVLKASSNLFRSESAEDVDAVRFALAALIDACNVCGTSAEEMEKVVACLRRMWCDKIEGEMLVALPPFFKVRAASSVHRGGVPCVCASELLCSTIATHEGGSLLFCP